MEPEYDFIEYENFEGYQIYGCFGVGDDEVFAVSLYESLHGD